MAKKESKFQKSVIDELKKRFPGCMVLKNDANYIQGIPDIIVLWKKRWATLECKKDGKSSFRPNQDHYVKRMSNMSFSSFIFPENCQEVLDELQHFFEG